MTTNEKTVRFTKQRLAKLRARQLPHMQASDWATIKEDNESARTGMVQLDDYLKAFVRRDNDECVCCGKAQGAKDMIDALTGNAHFKWGLVHGEGYCNACGYPGRAMHYVGDRKDPLLIVRNVILQYHPDGLSFD